MLCGLWCEIEERGVRGIKGNLRSQYWDASSSRDCRIMWCERKVRKERKSVALKYKLENFGGGIWSKFLWISDWRALSKGLFHVTRRLITGKSTIEHTGNFWMSRVGSCHFYDPISKLPHMCLPSLTCSNNLRIVAVVAQWRNTPATTPPRLAWIAWVSLLFSLAAARYLVCRKA